MIARCQCRDEARQAAQQIYDLSEQLRDIASWLADVAEEGEAVPPWVNRVAEMPINPKPFHSTFLKYLPEHTAWPLRELDDIIGVSIHHTISHSPLNTARYCTNVKGYPSIQYHLWVAAEDGCPVYLLAPLNWMIWHDNSGGIQNTISVGMAGRWDYYSPAPEQMERTARLCQYLMDRFGFSIDQVQGHKERAIRPGTTVCPGWGGPDGRGDRWRSAFYALLEYR